MNPTTKMLILTLGILVSNNIYSQQLKHQFKNPSFSGVGTGAHYLTIENQESTRKKEIQQKIQDEIDEAIAREENSTINRFIRNVEARIYSELSRQLVTSLFSDGEMSNLPGEVFLEGYSIRYEQDIDADGFEVLRLTITNETDPNDVTTITIPIGAFGGPGGP